MSTAAAQSCLFTGNNLRPNWPFGALEPWSFDLIMADPPWLYEMYSEAGEAKSPQAQYDCMALGDIAALPVGDLAADDCALWLWATWPMLPQAQQVMAAWGFRYVTGGAWHKRTKNGLTAFGTGYRLRCACEPFLIGVRGNPVNTRGTRNLIDGEAREHSRKPDAAFAAAEAWMPGARRLDLFSREARPGWTGWGNEARKFNQEGQVC